MARQSKSDQVRMHFLKKKEGSGLRPKVTMEGRGERMGYEPVEGNCPPEFAF